MARYIDAELVPIMADLFTDEQDKTHRKYFIEALSLIPTADVIEVKHGHWIRWYEEQKSEYGETYIPHCKCSECNKEFDAVASLSMKFCSNCGAIMDEDVE